MATRFRLNFEQIFGTSAQVLAGGTLTFAISHGAPDQLQAIYSDDALSVTKLNPVTLDSAGKHGDIFLQAKDYRVILKDAAGIVQPGGDVDPVHGGPSGTQPVNVFDFGAVGDGMADDTAAINAAEAARASGQTLLFPARTYKITGDITMTKPGVWSMAGAIFNSNAGRLLIMSSNASVLGGGGCTFNFTPGDPGASLDRAIRAHGDFSTNHGVAGPMSRGDTTFTASSSADAATLSAGDWVIIGAFTSDWQYIEWKQVKSVAGAIVTVYDPFRRNHGLDYPQRWHKVTPLQNIVLDGITIKNPGPAGCIGTDFQLVRETQITNCKYDIIGGGPAFAHYITDFASIRNFEVIKQPGRMSAMSASTNCIVSRGHFWCQETTPTSGSMLLETGTAWYVVEKLAIDNCKGGTGAIFLQWVDEGTIEDCHIAGDGTAIGIHILGGSRNRTARNIGVKLLEMIRFNNDGGASPVRAGNANSSLGDMPISCGTGFNVAAGVGNCVLSPVNDTSNTVFIQDTGTATVFEYKSGVTSFNADITFSTPGNLVTGYGGGGYQFGQWMFDGRYIEGHVVLHPTTFTFTTAAGQLYITTDATLPLARSQPPAGDTLIQMVSGQVTGGWTKAGYTDMKPYFGPNDRRITFSMAGSGVAGDVLTAANMTSGSTAVYVYVHFRYRWL